MKKLLAALIATLIIVTAMLAPAGAIADNEWETLKVTQILQVSNGYNYGGDEELEFGKNTMRGFAVSPDGSRLFCGFLNPGNSSALVMFDTMTSKALGYYVYYQPLDQKTSYPKGLDCDDRGYCYVGLAYYPNNGVANMAILKYDEKDSQTGFLKEVSVIEVVHEAEPGTGTKVGINGVKVKAVGNAYYAYVVVNYEVDYLYRFNVTNPETPVLDTSFGTDGRMVLGDDAFKIENGTITEGNYLDVDDDGTIWLAVTATNGEYLTKISDDGKAILGYVQHRKAYGVCLWDDKVLCCSQNAGSEIIVYKQMNFEKIAEFKITEDNTVIPGGSNIDYISQDPVNSVCNMKLGGGALFFGDQGNNSGDVDQVFMAGLTDDGKQFEENVSKSLEAIFTAVETTEEETTAAETPADETTASEPEITTAEEIVSTADVTTAAAPVGTTTVSEPAKTGCGSFAAGTAVLVSVLGAAIVIRRRK